MAVTIREHPPGGNCEPFLRAARVVFEGDPHFVVPLDFDLKERLDPKKNPFFQRGEAMLFTAWREGRLVGRCSASVDREHLRVWNDATGFFGFFDTVNDVEVARALVDAAAAWLRGRRMKRMLGPFSLYANEEVGVLVEGFDAPPSLMMGHSRSYQGALAEAAGFVKNKDLYAWKWESEPFPPRVIKAWEDIKARPEVRLRGIDMARMEDELRTVMDIYNDAWSGKWCFVPALPDEVKKVTKDMKLIIDPDLAFMADVDGRPMGMCILLPNLNEAIRDLDGKLFPFGWAKLLYRLKVEHPKSARLMMLGIRNELRHNKAYLGLSAAMYVEVAKRASAKGYTFGELSWTREDDAPINLGIRSMGAKIYKRYRVYEKAI